MVIVYIAGVISALTVIGILVYLYRETAVLPRPGQATSEPEPQLVPETESEQPDEIGEAEPRANQEPAGGESDESGRSPESPTS